MGAAQPIVSALYASHALAISMVALTPTKPLTPPCAYVYLPMQVMKSCFVTKVGYPLRGGG